MTPQEHRAFLIHFAKVHLTEARRRRIRPACRQRGFVTSLLESAAKARREAMAVRDTPAQGELFA